METKALVFRTWDDLVFANRNKEYGAYSIRRAYSKRIILGWGVSVAFIALLLLIPTISARFSKKHVVGPTIICEFPVIDLSYVPPILPKDPPKQQQAAKETHRTNTEVLVVTTPVETSQEVITNTTSSTGLEGEVGGETITGAGSAITDIPVVKPPQVMTNPEVMPSYEGGMEAMMKFIRKKLHYPVSARRQGAEGTVVVSFIVNGDGTVTNVSIIKGIHVACDEEAIRVISILPGWIGGKQGGMPVSVRMVLPIKFSMGTN